MIVRNHPVSPIHPREGKGRMVKATLLRTCSKAAVIMGMQLGSCTETHIVVDGNWWLYHYLGSIFQGSRLCINKDANIS